MTTELRALPEETIANLVEVTQDPIDAMKLAADVYAMTAYRAERASAAAAGGAAPRPPKPLSKYLRVLTTGLRMRLTEIVRHFDRDELDRLTRIAPTLLVRMDGDEPGLADEIVQLVCMAPEDAVAWIRDHLDEIEARFAS
jgi:hypothetical protein